MQLITGSHIHTNVIHSRALHLLSVEQFSMEYLQLQAVWIALQLHPVSSPFSYTHSESEVVAAAQTENARANTQKSRKSMTRMCFFFFTQFELYFLFLHFSFLSSLPCAWVHLSRKTMNTKRKSILQFFTVFRLKINWLKKRSKSIYLPSPRDTHTNTTPQKARHALTFSSITVGGSNQNSTELRSVLSVIWGSLKPATENSPQQCSLGWWIPHFGAARAFRSSPGEIRGRFSE